LVRECDDDKVTLALNDHDVKWKAPEHQAVRSASSCNSRHGGERNHICFEDV
jgi:hypothetical protein